MKNNLVTLLYFTLVLLATVLLLPKSLLGFYHVQAFSAIYLPNLEGSSKAIIGYTILMKVLSLMFSGNVLVISNIAGIDSVLSVIFSYLLLFRIVDGDPKIKTIVSFLYPIVILCLAPTDILVGYVSGFSMILYFIISFFLIDERRKCNYTSLFFIAFISWVTLGLFWHTVHVMMYLIFMTYMVIFNLYNIHKYRTLPQWNILIVLTVSFLFMWFYLRESLIHNLLLESFSHISISSIFGKGSFAGIYAYKHNLHYMGYIDIMRYLGYLLAYTIILIFAIEYAINIIKKKDVSKTQIFLLALFISEILFLFMYFISSGSIGPRILITFSYPLIIIMLNNNRQLSVKYLNNFNIRMIITLFLIIPVILTAVFSSYNYFVESPEQNIYIDSYKNSFGWSSEYSNADVIISDAHTSGHYQLFYMLQKIFDKKQIDFISVSYAKYEQIVDSTYNPSDNSLLIINEILYEKHLLFQSLQAWNKFEPLSPEYIGQNTNLNKIYNDGRVAIAQ